MLCTDWFVFCVIIGLIFSFLDETLSKIVGQWILTRVSSSSVASNFINDLDMDLERAIQMRRGIGQDQYVDGLEAPLGIGQPGVGGDRWKGDRSGEVEKSEAQTDSRPENFFFYLVVLSMTTLVVFVFIKLRGLLLFRILLSLFVSS